MSGVKGSTLRSKLALAAGILVAPVVFGCASSSGLPPGVSPEPMPKGGEWQGVYQGPYHIYLSIQREGSRAQGTWRAMGGRSGELWGDVSGNVLKFNWTEHDVQTNSAWFGRGYFVYRVKEPGDVPEIEGQWGLGTRDTDGYWYAVKRPGVAVKDAEKGLADTDTGPGQDNSAQSDGCLGAACVGDDR
jgi:hypothetical protein